MNQESLAFSDGSVKTGFSLLWMFILKFLREKSSPLSARLVAGKVPSCAALTE